MMVNNAIFILLGMVAIGAMIVTSNMPVKEKRSTTFLLVALSAALATYFGIIFYWILIPALLFGCLLGHWGNHTMDKRRMKYLKMAMADKTKSL